MSKRHTALCGSIGLAAAMFLSACDSSPEPAAEATTEVVDDTSEADGSAAEAGADVALETPVKQASGDPIRGPGGLEEKCLARVAEETGAKVNGTNHIEESEAAIEIYGNVDGAQAPWKCLGYKDGSIAEVMYTGSEGDA